MSCHALWPASGLVVPGCCGGGTTLSGKQHSHANKLRLLPGIYEMNINFYVNTNISWETFVGGWWSLRNLAHSMTLQICRVARVRVPTRTHARTHASTHAHYSIIQPVPTSYICTLQKYTSLNNTLNLIHAVKFIPDRWTLLSCLMSDFIYKIHKTECTSSRIICILPLPFYCQSQLP
jgi:hypothetical protein